MQLGDARVARNDIEPRPGTNQLRVTPVRSVDSLRTEALAASPPTEAGPFVPNDLVELVRLEPSIKLEIRYATTNNFLGTRFYDEARAFLQRPAAEALVRAHRALRQQGYGLLIHDAYRPWYVTKMFWDATPLDRRWLVADPAQGSRHNRGSAVDLTLYDLATGRPVEMPSTYDESTDRAYADYPWRYDAPALAPCAAPAGDGSRRLRLQRARVVALRLFELALVRDHQRAVRPNRPLGRRRRESLRPLEQQRPLALVARERGRALQLRPRFAGAAQLRQQVRSHRGIEVVSGERRLVAQRIDRDRAPAPDQMPWTPPRRD
jgi:D-alanyl-D-alanine dipeptidase